ncbi:MAG: hypothetical protein JXM71_06570 [Spirochaetales bacterium]|nr:hypothetical protein [Spirochaetales bacterium]
MKNFRALLESRTGFKPRTEAQALRGYAEGFLNPEFYIYRAVNIHPIIEEPWDVNEIDRLLAKEDLDVDTATLLMMVFEKMIRHPDKELALFAAESINALERRYLAQVQKLRKSLGAEPSSEAVLALVGRYRDMGRLFASRPVLGVFYLGEARRAYEKHAKRIGTNFTMLLLYLDVLIALCDSEAAKPVLVRALKDHPGNARLRYVAAKLAFADGSVREVLKNLEAMDIEEGDAEYADIQNFWTRGACRD